MTTTPNPWHDVKVTFETLWGDNALHQDFVYYVGHPEECGWTPDDPGACTFEDVLDEGNDSDHDHGTGEFRARVVNGYYDPVAGDDVEDTLEWERTEVSSR